MRLILGYAIVVVGLVLTAWTFGSPAYSQECGLTLEDFEAQIAADENAEIIGAAYYDGQVTDTSITVIAGDTVFLVGFKDGCHVVGPIPLEGLRDKGTPA